MKRLLKIVGVVVGVLVVLVVIAVVALPLVFDPNDHRERIAAEVKDRTGRDLTIDGNIELSVFPWLGLDVDGVSLGNAPGFAEEPFARFGRAQVRVKLVPLALRRELEMDIVSIDGLELHLARDAAGTGNWEDLARPADPHAPPPDAGPLAALALGGLEIRNASLTWSDAVTGQTLRLERVNVDTGPVALGQPVNARLAFDLAASEPEVQGEVRASARVLPDLDTGRVQASGIDLAAELDGAGVGGHPIRLALRGDLDYQPDAELLRLERLLASLDGTPVAGIEGRTELGGTLEVRLAAGEIDAEGLTLNTDLRGAGLPGGRLAAALATDARISLPTGEVVFSGLRLEASELLLGEVRARLVATGEASGSLSEQRYAVEGLTVHGALQGPGAAEELPVEASGAVRLDLAAGTLALADLSLAALDLQALASVEASGLDGVPKIRGALAVARFDPRALLERLGLPAPATADPATLRSAVLDTRFELEGEHLALTDLALGLDETRLTGSAAATGFADPALSFDLRADRLDADRYLPPAATGAQPVASPGAAAAGAATLPVDTLRALALDGRLRIESLQISGLSLASVEVGLAAEDGLIRLSPLKAALYGGSYTGDIVLDARRDPVSVRVDERITGVRADRLLADLGVDAGGLDLSGGASTLSLKAAATGDPARGTYALREVALEADLAGPAFPGGRLKAGAAGDVDLDLGSQTLASERLEVSFGEARATAAVQVRDLLRGPSYVADLSTASFDPRALLQALGQPAMQTADPRALGTAELRARVEGGPDSLRIEPLRIALDQTRAEGQISVTGFARPAIRFALEVDGIDVDRYLPPPKPGEGPAAGTPGAAAVLLPVDTLRGLDLEGSLAVATLGIANLTLTDVRLTARGKDGVLSLEPLGARLYGGEYRGNIQVDARGERARITVDERLSGVQAGPLLADLRGGRAPVTGTASAELRLAALGPDEATLRRTLGGEASFDFRDGAVRGLNVMRMICQGLAAVNIGRMDRDSIITGVLGILGGAARPAPAPGAPETEADETRFAQLSGSLQIRDGVASNHDLDLRSPLLRVSGEGEIDLAREQISYLARPALVSSCAGQGGATFSELAGVPIPVQISGPFDSPRLDLRIGPEIVQALTRSRAREAPAPSAQTPVPTEPAPAPAQRPDDPREAVRGILRGILGQ